MPKIHCISGFSFLTRNIAQGNIPSDKLIVRQLYKFLNAFMLRKAILRPSDMMAPGEFRPIWALIDKWSTA